MKIIRLSSIFILSLTLLFPSSSTEAEDALNHAYTYHWLARYKNSDSWDFLNQRDGLKAIEIIQNDSTIDQSNKIANIAKKKVYENLISDGKIISILPTNTPFSQF